MVNLGDMFDFAINEFGLEGKDFCNMFLCSTISHSLEIGEPKYLIGMCGIELALRVIEETTGAEVVVDETEHFYRSPDYWCGWAICYYQWLRGISYKEIL